MADEIPTSSPGSALGFFALFIIVLGVLWFAQGGADNPPSGPFLDQQSSNPTPTSTQSDSGGEIVSGNQSSGNQSSGNTKITLLEGQARKSDPELEYLEIRNEGSESVDMVGWSLKGKNVFEVKIPGAVGLYISNKVNNPKNVILAPGDKVIVSTGQSPLGVGFRVNKCMGFFSQNQNFYPPLYQNCFDPEKEEDWPDGLSDKCLDYIETLPRCMANLTHPLGLESACVEVINKKLGYNNCVVSHKEDEDFYGYKNEWRIYLNRNQELWKNSRETIILRDKDGNTIKEMYYK